MAKKTEKPIERGDAVLCENCAYWEDASAAGPVGICRALPPSPSWPRTQPSDWCGSFLHRANESFAPMATPAGEKPRMLHRES